MTSDVTLKGQVETRHFKKGTPSLLWNSVGFIGLEFGIFRRLGRYLHNLVLIKTHLAVEKGLKVDFFGFWTGFSQFQAEKAFWKGFKRGSKGHFFGKSIQH